MGSMGCRPLLGVLALLGTAPALAQAPPAAAAEHGAVAVGAEARRLLPATVSDAVVTIEVQGRDLRATAASLAQRSNTLLAFLRAQNVERLRTEGTGFEPDIQEPRAGPNRVRGYSGRTSVRFRTVPDRLPALLSGSLENGATGLGQSGSTPREEEMETARQELGAEATRTAMARARAVADAAGARVAGAWRIEVDPAEAPSPYPSAMAMRMERPAAPIAPLASAAGETEVVVRVRATVRLAPPG